MHLLPCFRRINNTNLFPFRVKHSVFLPESPISWRYALKESCKSCSDKNQPTLNCLNSFCFPYRSQSSVRGGDAEEKRHPAAHPCVLPHLHTLHHRPALHNEAPESARGVEERWGAEDPTRRSGGCDTGQGQRTFWQLNLFCPMPHSLFDTGCRSNKHWLVLQ